MTGAVAGQSRAPRWARGASLWLVVLVAGPAPGREPTGDGAAALLRAGLVDLAVAAYTRVLDAHPGDLDARKSLARALVRVHRPEEALAQYERVLAETPRDPEAVLGRAGALARLDRLSEAEATLRRAVADHPGLAEGHVALGTVLLRRGRADEATASFQRAHALAPGDPDPLVGLGRARAAAGDVGGARAARLRALAACDWRLAADPADRDARVARAQVLAALDRRPEALATFDRVLAAWPRDVDALLGRARLLQQEGRVDEAAVAAASAVAIDPGSAEALLALGDARSRQSRFDEAARAYAAARALAPRSVEPVLGLARLRLWQNDLAGARLGYEQALLLDPRNADAVDALARIVRTPAPARYRLDLGGRYEALGDGRSDWWQGTAVLSVRPRAGTALFVGLDQYHRNDHSDTQVSAGFGQALPDRFSVAGSVAYGIDASTTARYTIESEVARPVGTLVTPSVRFRWSGYPGGVTAASLAPGLEVYVTPEVVVLGRYFFTHASDAGDGHAGSVRVSLFPEGVVSAYGAVGYGRETFVADTVEEVVRGLDVLTLAAGVRWRVRDGLGVRLDYEYEDRRGSYVKHSVGTGVAIDF